MTCIWNKWSGPVLFCRQQRTISGYKWAINWVLTLAVAVFQLAAWYQGLSFIAFIIFLVVRLSNILLSSQHIICCDWDICLATGMDRHHHCKKVIAWAELHFAKTTAQHVVPSPNLCIQSISQDRNFFMEVPKHLCDNFFFHLILVDSLQLHKHGQETWLLYCALNSPAGLKVAFYLVFYVCWWRSSSAWRVHRQSQTRSGLEA